MQGPRFSDGTLNSGPDFLHRLESQGRIRAADDCLRGTPPRPVGNRGVADRRGGIGLDGLRREFVDTGQQRLQMPAHVQDVGLPVLQPELMGNWKVGPAADGEPEPPEGSRDRRAGPTGDRTYPQAEA